MSGIEALHTHPSIQSGCAALDQRSLSRKSRRIPIKEFRFKRMRAEHALLRAREHTQHQRARAPQATHLQEGETRTQAGMRWCDWNRGVSQRLQNW